MIEFVLFGQIGVVHPATVPFAETLISLWVTYLERPMSSLRASATIAMHRVMVEPRGTGMSMSSSGSHTTLRWRGLCAKLAHSQSKHTILSQTSASLAQLCFDLTERNNTREALSRSRLLR